MPATGMISEYQSEGGLVVEWKISNFFTLSEEDNAWYYSPRFSFSGQRWYLVIFPNGSSGHHSSEHVDLCLWKCKSDRSMRLSFSPSLKTAKGEKYHEEHGTKDFDEGFDCHDFYRFIQRSELTMKSSELVSEGVLTVVCTMKSSPSARNDSEAASASAECLHCKGTFDADSLSAHRKKCMLRPTKCPNCMEVVILEKWLNEHECQSERQEDEACASRPSTSNHERKVLHDLKKSFLQKEDCDVVIKVKGSEFPAHRFVLKARSPVFASTFQHDMKESATGIVEIEDCDPSSFLDFLCFLYCGDVRMISRENVFSLFRTADKYEVLDLKMECLEFLKKNITVNTFCETITLALLHSETELIDLATDFFVQNAEEILLTVKWQTFAAENPTQSNELFIKFVRSVKH